MVEREGGRERGGWRREGEERKNRVGEKARRKSGVCTWGVRVGVFAEER